MTEERVPYRAKRLKWSGLTPEEMEQGTQDAITKMAKDIEEINKDNDMAKCRRLVGEATVYATTGVCPRCYVSEHSAKDAEILAILSGITLHCIVCGKEVVW